MRLASYIYKSPRLPWVNLYVTPLAIKINSIAHLPHKYEREKNTYFLYTQKMGTYKNVRIGTVTLSKPKHVLATGRHPPSLHESILAPPIVLKRLWGVWGCGGLVEAGLMGYVGGMNINKKKTRRPRQQRRRRGHWPGCSASVGDLVLLRSNLSETFPHANGVIILSLTRLNERISLYHSRFVQFHRSE